MNKYKNLTIESLCEIIKFLNNDPQIAEIIRDNIEIKGINNLTDALLDIDLLYSVYEIAEEDEEEEVGVEYLFDIEMIKEKLEIALADAINKEDIDSVKALIEELGKLIFMHYEYFVFIFLGYLSEVAEIDMRDYTISILKYLENLLETNNIMDLADDFVDEVMYKEVLNIELDEEDEDYEFKKVCYEASLIVLGYTICMNKEIMPKYNEIEFITNEYND